MRGMRGRCWDIGNQLIFQFHHQVFGENTGECDAGIEMAEPMPGDNPDCEQQTSFATKPVQDREVQYE